MAQVVERNEPVIIRERDHDHIHEPVERHSATPVILGILLLLVLLAVWFFRYHPFSANASGGNLNVNVKTPTVTTGQ